MGGEGGRLEKVEQAKELFDAVLKRCSREEHPVFEVEALQTFEEFAVSVLETVSFVYDHDTPLDVLKLTLVSCDVVQ